MDPSVLISGVAGLHLHSNGQESHSFARTIFGHKMRCELKSWDDFTKIAACMLRVLKIAKEAIDHLTQGRYHEFDPLGSDCGCQIRALKIAKIARRPDLKLLCVATRQAIKVQMLHITNIMNGEPKIVKRHSFQSCVDEFGIDVQVPDDLLFVIEAHLLSRTKHVDSTVHEKCTACGEVVPTSREVTDCTMLASRKYPTTESQLEQLVKHIKVDIAARSCAFIQKEAGGNPAFLGKNVRVIQGRQELPCAYSLSFAIKRAIEEKIPILLRVQRALHTVEDRVPVYDVNIVTQPHTPINSPVMVIEGRRLVLPQAPESTSAYCTRLMSFSIELLTEMNAAQHDQYTDEKFKGLDAIASLAESENEKRRLYALREKAEGTGCSLSNQSLLLMSHVFVSTIARELGVFAGGAHESG